MEADSTKNPARRGRRPTTGRGDQMLVRVTPEFKAKARKLADRDRITIGELVAQSVELYENVTR
jgi:predicted HicB family RNase H-like nuclease